MLKLILADDEPVILRGIRKLVDWEKLGISIVGEYGDGRSAMEGILAQRPEIALLDISMPEMDGIEILKNIRRLELPTKVIFVSGFQDFEYARSAITYGAVDYLLKPLILDELLHALEKAEEMAAGRAVRIYRETGKETEKSPSSVLEKTTYLPVLAEILFDGTEDERIKKLVSFSFSSHLKEYLADEDLGMMLEKDDNIIMVLKGIRREDALERLMDFHEKISRTMDRKVVFVMGEPVDDMGNISQACESCLDMRRYFFFEEQIKVPVLCAGEPVFSRQVGTAELSEARGRMTDAIFAQDAKAFDTAFQRFSRVLCMAADGRKEDACYYFCSSIRHLEDKMNAMNLTGKAFDTRELLEKGRNCANYGQMKACYRQYLEAYLELLQSMVENNEKKDIVYAKAYIEEHYRENLSLEVMAEIVHMNPYYFSSFFKKNAGENFKDYVNKVRISHAVSLLLSTDLKSYEIAIETGFGDARSFADAFSRIYGETPANYKKRALMKNQKL